MRSVRQTFERLVVIFVVFILCAAIVFAIPAVRIWFFDNAPAAVVGMAGTGATSKLMSGIDPQLLASAMNDPKTRERLIEVWKKSIPEMEPDAVADAFNQLLSDPNIADGIVNLFSEMDPQAMADLYSAIISDPAVADHIAAILPRLDVEGLSRLLNQLMADEATINFVKGLIKNADSTATAKLVNAIMENEKSADACVEMLSYIDAPLLGGLINSLLADEDNNLSNLVNALISNMDPESLAYFVDGVLNNVKRDSRGTPILDAEGFPINESVDRIGELLGSLDANTFSTFLFQTLDPEQSPGTISFILSVAGNIKPDVNNPNDCALAVLNKLFTPGQGLHKALFGLHGVNDAIMDYLFLEAKLYTLFVGGKEFAASQLPLWETWVPNTVREEVKLVFGDTEWSRNFAEQLISTFFTQGTIDYMANFYSAAYTGFFYDAAYYARFPDMGFGEIPPWMKDNSQAWGPDFHWEKNTFHDPGGYLPEWWRECGTRS